MFGPTGTAAFNAGGDTFHRGFSIPLHIKNSEIKAETQKYLHDTFGNTFVIIIDERSMLDAKNF